MQIIYSKVRKDDGTEVIVRSQAIRSWSNQGCSDVFLFRGGDYGYRDGTLVRSREELEAAIQDTNQLRQAVNWWDRRGKVRAARFYEEKDARMARRAELHQREAEGGRDENLDAVLYSGTSDGEPFDASTWAEAGFTRRPDWWGAADRIVIGDSEYVLVKDDPTAGDPEKEKKASAKAKPAGKPDKAAEEL